MRAFITVWMTRLRLLQQIKTQNLQVLEISQAEVMKQEQYLLILKNIKRRL